MKTTLFLLAYGLGCGALAWAAPRESAGPRVERLFMPHGASPSSFAIGLPGGVNFCFDPVRGALSYVWIGDFADLSPARPGIGKFIEPVLLAGPIVYRETGEAPLRPAEPGRVPAVRFTGYSLSGNAVEFRYTVDGAAVREQLEVGDGGLERRWYIEDQAGRSWWRVVEGLSPVVLSPDAAGVRRQTIRWEAPRS